MKNPRITQEEIEIIKNIKNGNERAFSTLFNKYKSFVENILFGYLKDIDEAKDITNIVFLKVYNNLSSFTDYSSFGGWLRTITNNTAIDYLRKIKNKNLLIGENEIKLVSLKSDISDDFDVIDKITYDQILKEFDKLPQTTCKVCRMFYINNYTVEQISKKLKMPTGTIKSMLFRTRKHIQKQFKQFN